MQLTFSTATGNGLSRSFSLNSLFFLFFRDYPSQSPASSREQGWKIRINR